MRNGCGRWGRTWRWVVAYDSVPRALPQAVLECPVGAEDMNGLTFVGSSGSHTFEPTKSIRRREKQMILSVYPRFSRLTPVLRTSPLHLGARSELDGEGKAKARVFTVCPFFSPPSPLRQQGEGGRGGEG